MWAQEIQWQGQIIFKNVGFSHIWHTDNFGTPYLFLQPLKLATSNLVHNLGSTSSMLKQLSGLNLAGCRLGSIRKNLGPPIIFAAVKANDLKCGT